MSIELTEHQLKYINPMALKWLKALKSGKYNQAEDVLNDGKGGFCCLGVACEIDPKVELKDFGDYEYNGELNDTVLPDGYKKVLGLYSNQGAPDDQEGLDCELATHHCLTEMNDSGMHSFDQVADLILDQCSRLFVPISKQVSE